MSPCYLRFWGVRGSYPAPFATHMRTGGNTSCVEVRCADHVLIVDAGTGIIPLGARLVEQDAVREVAILVTHYHWDHISGLPFFEPAFTPSWTLRFFGPGNTEMEVAEALSLHPSTIRRAVKDMYLSLNGKVLSLKSLFCAPISKDSVLSRDMLKKKIAGLVDAEDRRCPLSDESLCEALKLQGIAISRRTVTAYRGELGIASVTARRVRT